tara:strand:+ start:805 stop:1137 length:333 start_codon:yes stop_codon:yes gene_type:complete
MKTKFTKGPWQQSHRAQPSGIHVTQVYDDKGKTICDLSWHAVNEVEGITTTDREANAHLIKMAPDMYAMLMRFLPMDEDGNGEFEYNDGSEYLGERVEALLAKARGESND